MEDWKSEHSLCLSRSRFTVRPPRAKSHDTCTSHLFCTCELKSMATDLASVWFFRQFTGARFESQESRLASLQILRITSQARGDDDTALSMRSQSAKAIVSANYQISNRYFWDANVGLSKDELSSETFFGSESVVENKSTAASDGEKIQETNLHLVQSIWKRHFHKHTNTQASEDDDKESGEVYVQNETIPELIVLFAIFRWSIIHSLLFKVHSFW